MTKFLDDYNGIQDIVVEHFPNSMESKYILEYCAEQLEHHGIRQHETLFAQSNNTESDNNVTQHLIAYHKMLRLLPNRGLVGSHGLKRTKKYAPKVSPCTEIHVKNEDFRLERLYQPKKVCFSSNYIFNFNLRSSFARLSNFNLIKTC